MIVATTIIQGGFTIAGVQILRQHIAEAGGRSYLQATIALVLFILWLFMASVLEIGAWATLYVALGAVGSTEEAVYFSTVTFTTLGFGDIVLGQSWRLLSSLEAANGLLMFGWSTALIFAAVQWVYVHGRGVEPARRKEATK